VFLYVEPRPAPQYGWGSRLSDMVFFSIGQRVVVETTQCFQPSRTELNQVPRQNSLVGKMAGHLPLTDLPRFGYAVTLPHPGQSQVATALVDGPQRTAQGHGYLLVGLRIYVVTQILIVLR
jgi:hypothetical protein